MDAFKNGKENDGLGTLGVQRCESEKSIDLKDIYINEGKNLEKENANYEEKMFSK